MVVHFDCPSPWAKTNILLYTQIVKSIKSQGHTVANDWDEPTYVEMVDSDLDQEDWSLLCKRALQSLEKADVVILESSNKGVFGIGYQTATALQMNKPVLLLVHKNSPLGSFVGGLEHELLSRAFYDETDVYSQIDSFLEGAR